MSRTPTDLLKARLLHDAFIAMVGETKNLPRREARLERALDLACARLVSEEQCRRHDLHRVREGRRYGLTRVAKKGLDFITAYIAEHGVPPSYSEICVAIGIKSLSGVSRIVAELRDRGHIDFIKRRPRSITLLGEEARP